MKYFILLIMIFLSVSLFADEPTEGITTTDSVVVSEGALQLSLRLVPQSIIKTDDLRVGALKARKKGEKVLEARVGDLAFLIAELTLDGKAVKNVQYELSFHHIEDDKQVFRTIVSSEDGILNWGQQFFDGAEHKITLKARPLNMGAFKPLKAEMVIAVEGLDPPSGVVIKSMAILLAICAAAMAVGYVFGFKMTAGKAKAT